MDIFPIDKQFHRQLNTPPPKIFPEEEAPQICLPEDLIIEIMCLLSVKHVLQLKCVCKSWNRLISDPAFVEKHLKKSSQNPHLTVMWKTVIGTTILHYPFRSLIENPLIIVHNNISPYLKYDYHIAGSYNGLICLFSVSQDFEYEDYSICFWNPSMRKISQKLGCFRYINHLDLNYGPSSPFGFAFGHDASTNTYKVVAFRVEGNTDPSKPPKSEVRVFNLGGSCWKIIQSFPLNPFDWLDSNPNSIDNGVHLSGTINWLVIHNYNFWMYNYKSISHVDQFFILALDLSTETYNEMLLPQGFDEVPCLQPVLRVLMGHLCFSHDKKSEFVLWQMKEYGIQESWTQLFKIRYENLEMHYFNNDYQLVCLYKYGDVVILGNKAGNLAVIYNLRDEIVERIRITNSIGYWCYDAVDYVESLVSIS